MEAVQRGAVKRRRTWPLFLIGLPAAVAVWSGWVGLGGMCGFGLIHPLPGIADGFQLNTAITLPIGVEAYGGYALGVWADLATPERVRKFAFRSAIGSLLLGLLGQVVFHLLAAQGYVHAPWLVTMFVSCIPVAAIGFGMGLHQLLIHTEADDEGELAGAGAPPAPQTAVQTLDDLARTITLASPAPDPGPPGEMPDGPWLPVPPDVDGLLHDWARPAPAPVHHEEQAPPAPADEPDEIELEAAKLFAESQADEPARAPASTRTRTPAKRPVARQASARTEWTPASVGRTEDEVIELTRSLTRNQLAAQLPCSRGTADKLRAKYIQHALNGSR